MGLYDGPIDGLDGPKTRSAITLWQQKTAQAGGQSGTLKQQDDIASLISGSLATAGNVDKVTTQSLNNEHRALTNEKPAPANQQPANKIATNANEMRVMSAAPQEISKAAPSQRLENQGGFKADTADIMRVQAGLRAFGDDHVVVTGTEDENTAEALKNFQKMFSLTVTGKINQEVIDKMKDIGLIG
ncbi:peptidoglycan-binding protein [Bartonella sp. B10834H15]|nr:peptidoglycan-binding protein [Bartonella choladocola]MBI0013713.1 peptidoglycan-binding protein [Bartonella sp. B10834G3]